MGEKFARREKGGSKSTESSFCTRDEKKNCTPTRLRNEGKPAERKVKKNMKDVGL